MQFDVFPNPSPKMRAEYPFVLDLQSNLLSALPTRLVAPLAISKLALGNLPRRLCPTFTINEQTLFLVAFESAPLDKRLLSGKKASLKGYANEILGAMDAVISGF